MIIIAGAEAGIAMAEGFLKRVVQRGGTNVEEGLHARPVPAHLLFLVHTLGHDLVDRTLDERRGDRLIAPSPGRRSSRRAEAAYIDQMFRGQNL